MQAQTAGAAPRAAGLRSGSRRPAPSRAEIAALVLLGAVGLGLRLTDVSRSLFTDEAYSLALAQRSFGHMFTLFGYEANGTPYPIVLWPLIRLFGDGEAVLRAPAVAAGVASIPALWWAARRYTGAGAAVLAAALLALSPMAVFYSQSARQYSFVVLAACLAFGALPRALESGSRRGWWVAYAAAMALLAYAEILAAPIVLPAQAILVWRGGRRGRRSWLLSLLAVLVACIPLIVAVIVERSRRNALYWLPRPDRSLVTLALQEFTAGFSEVTSLRWLTLAAGGLLVAGALLVSARERAEPRRTAFAVAAAWGLLPGLLLLVASFVTPVFYPRYAIVALPGLCLLAALAAARLWSWRRGPLLAGCGVAVLCAAALAADVRQRHALQENWPPVAAALRERAPGQPVIVDGALVLPTLGYYVPAFRSADGNLVVQEWHDEPVPAGFAGYRDRGGYGAAPVGPPPAAAFAAAARRGAGTVWMVVSEVDPNLQADPRHGAAVAWARTHCRVSEAESLGVWVLRATRCAPAAAARRGAGG